MRIAVLSCLAYSDAWVPFWDLFRKFWPDCPYDVWFVSDHTRPDIFIGHHKYVHDDPCWNKILARFITDICSDTNEPVMVFLEDYFLTSPVNTGLVHRAATIYHKHAAACVRLYPCPGGDGEVLDDHHFSMISYDAPYRVSTQVALWNPRYLRSLANQTNDPRDFELSGTRLSRQYIAPFISFRREVKPWPLEYICTAIVRGVWQQGAIDHCKAHGIELDLSRRPVQSQSYP